MFWVLAASVAQPGRRRSPLVAVGSVVSIAGGVVGKSSISALCAVARDVRNVRLVEPSCDAKE